MTRSPPGRPDEEFFRSPEIRQTAGALAGDECLKPHPDQGGFFRDTGEPSRLGDQRFTDV